MTRRFSWLPSGASGPGGGTRFILMVSCAVLAILNAIALFLYLAPPGGSRQDLTIEQQALRTQINSARAKALRLKTVAAKVQTGGTESSTFETIYFLPRRRAYSTIVAEIQRMAKISGMHERDAVYSEEPIEGTADLSLLNSSASYEGSYGDLMRFLYEVDRSPMLLMLDTLQAAPQQKGGQISTSIRFQAIIRDDGSAPLGGTR